MLCKQGKAVHVVVFDRCGGAFLQVHYACLVRGSNLQTVMDLKSRQKLSPASERVEWENKLLVMFRYSDDLR